MGCPIAPENELENIGIWIRMADNPNRKALAMVYEAWSRRRSTHIKGLKVRCRRHHRILEPEKYLPAI